jgi:hypothetical protein
MEEFNPTQQYGAKPFDGVERRTGQQRYEGDERRKQEMPFEEIEDKPQDKDGSPSG